mgnify:CR=1 FL=1
MAIRLLSGETIDGGATFEGNVLIGASSTTDAKLNIIADGETTNFVKLKSTKGTGVTYGLKTNGTNSDVLAIMDITAGNRIAALGNNEVSFNIAGVQKLGIDSSGNATFSGNVTITTTGQGLKVSTAAGQSHLQFTDSTNSKNAFVNYDNDVLKYFSNGPVEQLSISSTGATFAGDITLDDDLNFSTNGFADISNTGSGAIRFKPSSQTLALTLTGANATFAGTGTFAGQVEVALASNQIKLSTGTAGDGYLNIGHFANGSFIGTYGDDGGAADLLRFGVHSGDVALTINSDKSATFVGNIDISSTLPRINLIDTDNNDDWSILNNNGTYTIFNSTDATSAFFINSLNNATFAGDVTIKSGKKVILNNSVNTANGSIVCPGGGSLALQSYGNDMIYLNENSDIRFSTSSSEKMRLDSSGNLGIGTDLPTAKLHLAVSSANDDTFQIFNGSVRTHLLASESTNGVIYMRSSANTNTVRINSSGLSYFNGGNVGIGTTSPASKLEVYGNVQSDTTSIANSAAYIRGADVGIAIGQSASSPYGTWIQSQRNTDGVNFPLSLNPSGSNVGIGTTSPDAKFQVEGNVKVGSASGASWTDAKDDIGGLDVFVGSGSKAFQVWDDNDQTNARFVVERAGNVGIGTTSPDCKLTVADSGSGGVNPSTISSNTVATFRRTGGLSHSANISILAGTSGASNLNFGDRDNEDAGIIGYTHDAGGSDYMAFTVATSERMRILANGNVGIGTTLPNGKLNISNGGANGLEIDPTQSSGGVTLLQSYNRSGAAYTTLRTNAGSYEFQIADSTKMTILSGGNVGIGETNPASNLVVRKDTAAGRGGEISIVNYAAGGTPGIGNEAALNFGLENSTYHGDAGNAQIKAITTAANNRSDMVFSTWNGAAFGARVRISHDGNLTAIGDLVAYGSPSDKRLKENIKPIESALDKVSKLQGVTFDWKKSDSILDIKEDIGFIAQDVQKVIPELVRENEDGMLSMRHQGIAPILLEAIKELKAEVEELKKQIK